MKFKFHLRAPVVFAFLLISATLFSQIPVGGLQMNTTTGTTYKKIGSSVVTEITVADQLLFYTLRISNFKGLKIFKIIGNK